MHDRSQSQLDEQGYWNNYPRFDIFLQEKLQKLNKPISIGTGSKQTISKNDLKKFSATLDN